MDEITMEELQEVHFSVLNALYVSWERWMVENRDRLTMGGLENAEGLLMSIDEARDGEFHTLTLNGFRKVVEVMTMNQSEGAAHLNNS